MSSLLVTLPIIATPSFVYRGYPRPSQNETLSDSAVWRLTFCCFYISFRVAVSFSGFSFSRDACLNPPLLFWHRIVPTWVPRMTTQKASYSHTAPTHNAKTLDSGIRVSTTTWVKAAHPKTRHFPHESVIQRKGLLVPANTQENELLHIPTPYSPSPHLSILILWYNT